MDRVRLKGIVLFGHVGVHEAERDTGQKLEIDVELSADLEAAATADALADTLDYEKIYRTVEATVAAARCRLLETLARTLCRTLLDGFEVAEVTVRVRKPNVPFAGTLSAAEVEFTRHR